MLATQLKYDLLMFSRELFYLVFSLIVPPVTYIFMGQLYGDVTYAGNLNYAQTYTPSFILLITFTVVFFAFGFDQVSNRAAGIEKRISLSPVSKNTLLLSSILKSVVITSFGFFLISLMGVFVYDLSLQPLRFIGAYGFFILLNAVLLVIASAIYSFFNDMKSALVFSIIIFQVVMFTGDFTMPVSMMPKFIQVIANFNPLYHMNHLFIAIWNGQLEFDNSTFISIGFVIILVLIAFFIISLANKRRN